MRRIIPGLLALLWTATASAAATLQFGPPQSWVKPLPLPAAGTDTQAAQRVLLLDYQVDLTPQTVRYYAETVTHIQTPEGLSAAGTITVVWNPDTDVVTIHKIHILRGTQVIDVLGGAGQTFTVARRETNLDYATLDDTLTGILQPAGLQVGDTVDIAYTLERTDPILAGTLGAQVEISPELAVSQLHISARWPAAEPVKWRATEGLTGVRDTHEHGMRGVTLTMADVQPILEPKDAPPRYMIRRGIEFSALGSWADVAKRMAPLFERASQLTSGSLLQAQIAQIRAATPDPKQRAGLALALVEDQIRYLFLAMNNGGLVPATADQTWAHRYGDCKAKTVLLLALLHGLGIEAQPVAVSVTAGDGLDERLPSIAQFDHVLVQATIAGQTYWLDGTRLGDRSLDRLHVPYYRWGLSLTSQTPGLVKMVPPPLTAPALETSVSIDASNGVTQPAPFHAEIAFHDYAAVTMKQRLGNLTPAQLDAGLRTVWSRNFDNVTIKAVGATYEEKSEIERMTMDGTVKMDWGAGEYEPPELTVGYDADFERQAGPHQDAPFAVAYPGYVMTTVTIKLPIGGQGFSIAGADIKQTLAGFEYLRQSRIDGGVFTGVASARSVQPEFPAAEAAADQEALRKLAKTTLDIKAPAGHVPTEAEIGWGLPSSNSTTADYVRSGYLLSKKSRYDEAIADYDAALALNSSDAVALADRGISYFWKGDKPRARADFEAALAVDPHQWVAFNGRGLLALAAHDDAGAITAFSEAIRNSAKDEYAFGMRAGAYWRTGKEGLALADYSEAIRQDPTEIALYGFRASLLEQEGKKAEALRQAQLVIAANPKSPNAYFTAGAIYMAFHQSSEARAAFDRAVAVTPDAETYLTRANYRLWTDLPGKRADIENALKLAPTSRVALAMLSEAQMTVGQYAQAADSLTHAMDAAHEPPEMLILRGIAYEKAGKTALAQADFSKAHALAKQPGELNNICWNLATHDVSLASALDDCNAAVAKAPASYPALDSRGFVLMRLGRYKEAIASYDSALKLNPLEANSLYGRGVCELRAGQKARGRADIKKATALSYAVADQFAHYGIEP
ncbi:MAG TPA: tetratricopeptide repeat protein [Steroidobacteraceae bacterium]|nr:tetratricopeptide repeat protein [Steroidobacteraceae bacterium]